jgi:hypothetical protein
MSKTNSRLFLSLCVSKDCLRVRFLRDITGKVVYRVSQNSRIPSVVGDHFSSPNMEIKKNWVSPH